ncbi:MAG: tetratricopeptide repeat protein, partial [Candidatus Brocadiales bacterium]
MGYAKMTIVCAIIFFIMLMHACAGHVGRVNALQNNDEAKYTVVILPLQNNTTVPIAANSADALFRSELIKTGYFNVIERDASYETIMEFVPGDNLYIGGYRFNDNSMLRGGDDSAGRRNIKHRGDIGWLDMPIRIEKHTIVRFAEQLDADFAITGTINQFGEKIRFDIELINAKSDSTLASLTADADGFERLPDIVNLLTLDVTNICRRVNAQRDANNIVSRYKQGLYTYEVVVQELEELFFTIPDSFAPPVTLLSIYLERPGMEEEIIAIGEKILTLFDPRQDEHFQILQSMGIDPFDELAEAYEKSGYIDKVIETHSEAIKVYPVSIVTHYKKLALAYKKIGLEQQHIETLQKGLFVCTIDPDFYYYLGKAMEETDKFEQAVEYYRKCLKYTNDTQLSSELKKKISQLESETRTEGT